MGFVIFTGLYCLYLVMEKLCLLCGCVWGCLTDCRYSRGKGKGVGLAPNKWKQSFIGCNNHILVEVTVLCIFTNMRMRLKVDSWDMTLHHIRKGFSPCFWHCIISQLPWVMILHHIPEERRPQPHRCGNFGTQKIRNLNVSLVFYFLLQ